MEITRGIGEKERKKQRDSNAKGEVFCLWRFGAHFLSL